METFIGLMISVLTIIGINKLKNMLLNSTSKTVDTILHIIAFITIPYLIRDAKRWLDKE